MITVTVEPTRQGFVATTVVDGETYAARGRFHCVPGLARKLTAAGIADQPLEIQEPGFATWRNASLWKMARKQ